MSFCYTVLDKGSVLSKVKCGLLIFFLYDALTVLSINLGFVNLFNGFLINLDTQALILILLSSKITLLNN